MVFKSPLIKWWLPTQPMVYQRDRKLESFLAIFLLKKWWDGGDLRMSIRCINALEKTFLKCQHVLLKQLFCEVFYAKQEANSDAERMINICWLDIYEPLPYAAMGGKSEWEAAEGLEVACGQTVQLKCPAVNDDLPWKTELKFLHTVKFSTYSTIQYRFCRDSKWIKRGRA